MTISAVSMKIKDKTSAPVSQDTLAELNEIKFALMAKRGKACNIDDVVSLLIAEHKERQKS
jgi:hypothetical protein